MTKTDELMRLARGLLQPTLNNDAGAIDAAETALRYAIEEVVSGWLPIETAPKDGTHILLANKDGASEGAWLTDVDHGADWEGQLGMAGWWRADCTDWPNTHWQPLPEPPEAS